MPFSSVSRSRTSEPKLCEEEWVASCRRLRHGRKADGVLAADQVIGEMEQIDRDAGEKQRIFHQRQHRTQLRPREIEGLEVLEASRAKDAALQRLATGGELWKQAFGVDARQRREGQLAR